MEHTPRKRFIYGPEDHLIAKLPNPPKENKKWRKQVNFIVKGNRVCENDKNNSNQKI